jgi:hypothetical protein
MAKMKIAPRDRPRVKLECLRLLATLKLDRAKAHLISGFVDTYLRLNAAEMEAYRRRLETLSPEEKVATLELTTSWKEEGIAEGMAHAVIRMLQRRFGELPTRLEALLRELSPEQLDEITDELLDFASLADVQAWVARYTTSA